jgi:hypothetical protein
MAKKIDLPRQFAALASELEASIERGRILHGTANIRDSGEPFEVKFRDVIGSRLPPPHRVRHGYLFDGSAIVTPQIDGMIVDERQSHQIIQTDGGCSYLPYLAASVIFEIKNSLKRPKKALSQIRALQTAMLEMRRRATASGAIAKFTLPLSVLVVGDTTNLDFASVQRDFAAVSGEHPAFTYLADRARLIARRNPLEDFMEEKPEYRAFLERGTGDWALYGPPTSEEFPAGPMLLWLYFAILSHVNHIDDSSLGVAAEFYQGIDRLYRISDLGRLKDLTAWA